LKLGNESRCHRHVLPKRSGGGKIPARSQRQSVVRLMQKRLATSFLVNQNFSTIVFYDLANI
jgi:hypothetical protein